MSADFWAGYISGAVGIIIGNPLDILKVRLQAAAGSSSPSQGTLPHPALTPTTSIPSPTSTLLPKRAKSAFLLGTAAPVLGYGALNALLFVTYNRVEALLANGNTATNPYPYTTAWIAGAAGGLATWVVSTPTELVKCRAQVWGSPSSTAPLSTAARARGANGVSSWAITKQIFRTEGIRGLYFGGGVTAIRDSVGYGFYFWGYELCTRWWMQLAKSSSSSSQTGSQGGASASAGSSWLNSEAARVLVCGGIAGIITWASIFPLDVIKTKVQTQAMIEAEGERRPLLERGTSRRRMGAWEVAKETYKQGGIRPFFSGLTVCSIRAFIVNAVQWAVYEWIMMELGQGKKRQEVVEVAAVVA